MIELYSHKKHFEMLREWNDARGQYGLEEWMLPELGLVVGDVAIAFLVTTNSPVAWVAHWTVAPNLSREKRDVAFTVLELELEKMAKERGFRLFQTLGMVGHSLSTRLVDLGFHSAPGEFTFFVKDLRE